MHIKNMHESVEKLASCVKSKFDEGMDCIDAEEMTKATEMICNLSKAMYYASVVKAMDEAKEDEEAETKYYTKRNRKMPMIDDMSYEPHMMPERMSMEVYNPNGEIKDTSNRYYDGNGNGANRSNGNINGMSGNMGNRSGRGERMYFDGEQDMSKVEKARQAYMDAVEMHKGNSQEEKQTKVRELDKFMTAFSEDMMQMANMMSPEEKTVAKTKLTNMISKM